MKRGIKVGFWIGGCLIALFVIWTVLVCTYDVRAIGPLGSSVGFASINSRFRDFVGVNFTLYEITDVLGLIPIGTALGFAILGLWEWISRKSIFKVDFSLLMLGIFYAVVILIFIMFEKLAINYRPVLIDGVKEASYPSSTTLLTACVMPSAIVQFKMRVRSACTRRVLISLSYAFLAFMIAGRILSGVHWFSDIVGGALISAGLVVIYFNVCKIKHKEFKDG